MFNINKFLPMTGFKPQTSGNGSDCSTNWATTTAAHQSQFLISVVRHEGLISSLDGIPYN